MFNDKERWLVMAKERRGGCWVHKTGSMENCCCFLDLSKCNQRGFSVDFLLCMALNGQTKAQCSHLLDNFKRLDVDTSLLESSKSVD